MDNESEKSDCDINDLKPELTETDEEDDCEGYFLQPVGETIDLAEKIAQANKQLFEEEVEEKSEKGKKVQFSEDLVNFEPDIDYESIDSTIESIDQSLLEESQLKLIPEEPHDEDGSEHEENDGKSKQEPPEARMFAEDDVADNKEEIIEEILETTPDINENSEKELNLSRVEDENHKLLLILFPQDQNSSCESIIGEDILENDKAEKTEKQKENWPEMEKVTKTRMLRPKSAGTVKHKNSREVPKISPTLNCPSFERKGWQVTKNPMTRSCKNKPQATEKKNGRNLKQTEIGEPDGGMKKIIIDTPVLGNHCIMNKLRRCDERPKSSLNEREKVLRGNRPQTAPMKRTCCVIKSELPQYNGLRSEYGLSAEQLQERKQATLQLKNQRKQEKLKERQEELRKKAQNEEVFQNWLLRKKKGNLKKGIRTTDTLTRSDVYIQNHASYALNKNVPYSVNYNLTKKIHIQAYESKEKSNRKVVLEKIFDKISPHYKRSFNIYLGMT